MGPLRASQVKMIEECSGCPSWGQKHNSFRKENDRMPTVQRYSWAMAWMPGIEFVVAILDEGAIGQVLASNRPPAG